MADSKEDKKPGRRALVLATIAGTCVIGAAAAGPALAFVAAPLSSKGGSGRWVRIVKIDHLKDGEPKRVAVIDDRRDAWTIEKHVELGSVWLVKKGAEVIAFSAVCPHLGCSVNAVDAGFACPCHTSAFEIDGKRKAGPAPRDLDRLATRIQDGHVEVDFRRFRIGIANKVET